MDCYFKLNRAAEAVLLFYKFVKCHINIYLLLESTLNPQYNLYYMCKYIIYCIHLQREHINITPNFLLTFKDLIKIEMFLIMGFAVIVIIILIKIV